MLSKLRRRAEDEKGFTLIELLVVVLIIGILAAIAIPAFLGQRAKAQDGNAKATVRSAQTAMESYATDNDGKYTGATVAKLQDIEPTLNDTVQLAVSNITANGYTVSEKSKSKFDTVFSISRNDGTSAVTRTCDQGGKGGCKTGGSW